MAINIDELTSELRDVLGEECNIQITKRDLKLVIKLLFVAVKQHLKNGVKVNIFEFGTFKPYWIKARQRTAPNATQPTLQPACMAVSFKSHQALRKMMRDVSLNWNDTSDPKDNDDDTL